MSSPGVAPGAHRPQRGRTTGPVAVRAAVPWWASDDPWVLSPDEVAALEAKRLKFKAAMAALPQDPPF